MTAPGAFLPAAMDRAEALFRVAADPSEATWMAAYMRDQFPFLGVKSALRRALARDVFAGLPRPTEADLLALADAMWALPEREFQYFAVDVLVRHVRVCGPGFLGTVHRLVTTKSWWDTIDALTANVVGPLVAAHPELAVEMDRWVGDGNVWAPGTAPAAGMRSGGPRGSVYGGGVTGQDDGPPSERATVRRERERAVYDPGEIRTILDAGLVAHVAVAGEDGAPRVVPMSYGRIGDFLYLHGSVASRLMRALRDGADACVAVTVVDGVVLARSAFHTSMNYRSVVVHGRVEEVVDSDERLVGLQAIMTQVAPGRWEEVRPPTDAEWRQTIVLRLPLTEASAKVRTGGPNDDAGDLALPQWAGVIPLRTVSDPPRPDGELPPDKGPPPPRW